MWIKCDNIVRFNIWDAYRDMSYVSYICGACVTIHDPLIFVFCCVRVTWCNDQGFLGSLNLEIGFISKIPRRC
jgi:hypothetical protein